MKKITLILMLCIGFLGLSQPASYMDLGNIGASGSYTFDTEGSLNISPFAGNTDTEMALWDASGTLIAQNDDNGGGGLWSLITETLADGDYYIGVSEWDSVWGAGFTNTGSAWEPGEISDIVLNVNGVEAGVFVGASDALDQETAFFKINVGSTGGGSTNPSEMTTFCSTETPLAMDPPITVSTAATASDSGSPGDTGMIGAGLGEYNIASVDLNITSDWAGEMEITLQSPSGTLLQLADHTSFAVSSGGDIVFSDDSTNGTPSTAGGNPLLADYNPEGGSFAAAFNGEDINGDWFVIIADDGLNDGNTLNSYCISFSRNVGNAPEIFCPADFVADNDEGVCGAIVNFAPPIALDDEDGVLDPANVVQTGGLPTGSEFPVGDNDVTFTATDSHGNETSCTFVVTILDAEAPMAVCQDFTVVLDEDGLGSMMDSDIDGGSTDNCGVDSVVASQTAFTCADVGENTIILEVFDAAGNSTTCEATVTVVDETAPVIVCIGEQMDSVGGTGGAGEDISVALPPVVSVISVTEDLEVLDVNVDLNISHTWTGDLTITLESPAGTSVTIFDGAADGCSEDDLMTMLDDESANSFDCLGQGGFPNADYMPSNALDAFDGEMSMGDWTLTVADGVGGDDGTLNSWGITIGIEPIAAPPYLVDLNADGTVTIPASDLIESVDEACGYTVSVVGGEAGSSLATLFATNNNGAAGGAVYFDVTVGDNELSLEAIDVNTDAASFTADVYAFEGTYVNNEGDISVWGTPTNGTGTGAGIDMPSNVVLDAPITLSANTTYAMAVVMDATAGHFYTNGDGSNEAFSNADLSMALGAASNVPFDGSPFAPRVFNGALHYSGGAAAGGPELMLDCSNLGENIIEVVVTDDAGNSSTCFATVVVSDVTAPVLVCEDTTIELGEDGTYTIDPLDLIGTMPTTYNVITIGSDNGSGAEGFTDLTVEVTEAASLSFDWEYTTDDDPGWDGFGYLLNGTYTMLTDAPASGSTMVDVLPGDVFGFRAHSDDGSFGAGTTTVSNFMPGFTGQFAPENWTETLDNSDGSATFVEIPGGTLAYDACGIDVLIADLEMVTCDDIGTPITVTVFATDASGNVTSCTSVVTVVDAMAPVLTCPEDESVMVDPNGSHTLADYIGDGAATATDNCTDPVTDFTQSPAPGTILGVGVHIITFTATDEYGNVSTCEMELDLTILGTQDNELNNAIALYPNPANEQVTISNSSNIALESAMIYDLNGKLVSQINLQDMQSEQVIDVSAYATGVYMVYITGEQSSVVKRMIKE